MARHLLVPLAAAALVLGAAGCSDGAPEPRETELIDLSGDAPSDGGGEQPSDGGGGEPSDGGGDEPSDGGEEEPVSAAPDIPPPDQADYPESVESSHKGAMQFSEYFVAVVYWSLAVGDSSLVSEMSTVYCTSCDQVEEAVAEAVEAGDLLAPVDIAPVETRSYPSQNYDIEVAYFYDIRESGAGSSDSTGEYAPYRALVGVVWIDDAWRVAGLVIEEDGEANDSAG